MNTKAINQANNADLRGSWQALQRAAQRAREVAAKTGTELIVSREGVIERLKPSRSAKLTQVQEPAAPYENKP